jgi:hypothetical protein
MSKTDLLKHVDILTLVDIQIFETHPGHLSVDFYCHQPGKHLVFDEKALEVLNHQLSEELAGRSTKDPNTRGYIQEYVGRMIDQLSRHNLCAIEDIPDAPDDHYAKLRKIT